MEMWLPSTRTYVHAWLSRTGFGKIKLEATEWMYWYTSSSDSKSSRGRCGGGGREGGGSDIGSSVLCRSYGSPICQTVDNTIVFFPLSPPPLSSSLFTLRFRFYFFLYRLRLPNRLLISLLFPFPFTFILFLFFPHLWYGNGNHGDWPCRIVTY